MERELNKYLPKDIVQYIVLDYATEVKENYDGVMHELSLNFNSLDDIHRINQIYGGGYYSPQPENLIRKYFAYIKEKKIIDKRMKGEVYISFYGDQYCEDCPGWDGMSRRCECGNRRVDWESDGDNYYAEAW